VERDARGRFKEEFRKEVILKIETGQLRVSEAKRQYGILGHSTLLKWHRKYGRNNYSIMTAPVKTNLSGDKKRILLLQNQVKVLERELREARLKQATLETLIDVAEETYSIPIKKNSGGKQSIE
jgi:transposase